MAEERNHMFPRPIQNAFGVEPKNDNQVSSTDSVNVSLETNALGIGSNGSRTQAASNATTFIFTARRSENMLEMLSAKKSSILVEVNLESRTITFHTSHDTKETYSCAAINVREGSRLNVHMKIQTGNSSINKRISFLSHEDRLNFLRALEHGKLVNIENLDQLQLLNEPSRLSLWNAESWHRSSALRITHAPPLVDGERIIDCVHRVTNIVMVSQQERAVQGFLQITNYRLLFAAYDATWSYGSFELPVAAIDDIQREGLMVVLASKDLRIIRLAMHDAFTQRDEARDESAPPLADLRWLRTIIQCMKPPHRVVDVFAFQTGGTSTQLLRKVDGRFLYSPLTEYQRLGIIPCGDEVDPYWGLLRNTNFIFSPTYPQHIVVPSAMSDNELIQSSRFRSKGRLPAVVWRHPNHSCVLARSSQPFYGLTSQKCEADQLLLRLIRNAAAKSNGQVPQLHIVDARKPIATQGNRLKGKGVENSHHYDGAIIEFMGIGNIHKMRESLHLLKALLSPDNCFEGDKYYYSRLEHTKWLKHIMRILAAGSRVAEILHDEGASVLVQCSDGWDRTPQIVSIAQLILDPFYRTIRGFAVLMEKEWCSFGHKFADRIGVGSTGSKGSSDRSPVVWQWLDCVYQMLRQFPTAFEFNETILLHVADALFSGLYGTFLFNSERQRTEEPLWEKTSSVWTPILLNPAPYTNPLYTITRRPLYPRANLKRIVLWDALYLRWDPENDATWPTTHATTPINHVESDMLEKAEDEDRTIKEEEQVERKTLNVIHNINVALEEIDVEDEALKDVDEESSSSEEEMMDEEPGKGETRIESGSNPMLSSRRNSPVTWNNSKRFMKVPFKTSTIAPSDDAQNVSLELKSQRRQARTIQRSLEGVPDKIRIKYLERLLWESMAREARWEALVDNHSLDSNLVLTKESATNMNSLSVADSGQEMGCFPFTGTPQDRMQKELGILSIRPQRSASVLVSGTDMDLDLMLSHGVLNRRSRTANFPQ